MLLNSLSFSYIGREVPARCGRLIYARLAGDNIPARLGRFTDYCESSMTSVNGRKPAGRSDRLTDAGFGQFDRHAKVDLAYNLVQPGIARVLGQPLAGHFQTGQHGAVHAAVE